MSFNTAVSAFMICDNELGKKNNQSREVLEPLVVLLSPLAPFTAEYLWQAMGHDGCLLKEAAFPVFNPKYLVEDSKEYPISINGKVRTKLEFSVDATQDEIRQGVMDNEIVQKWLEGKGPRKVIVVPGKIVNVVI